MKHWPARRNPYPAALPSANGREVGTESGPGAFPYSLDALDWVPQRYTQRSEIPVLVVLVVATILHGSVGLFLSVLVQGLAFVGASQIGFLRLITGIQLALAIMVGVTAYKIWDDDPLGTVLLIPLGAFAIAVPLTIAVLQGGLLFLTLVCLVPGLLDVLAGVVVLHGALLE